MTALTTAEWPAARRNVINEFAGHERFMQGDEAVAVGAIYAGCDFFGAYPITPASEIAENLATLLPRAGGKFVQFEDELASISAGIGAAWAGSRAMTATSGPGFSLMQENIGYAHMTETPLVIVNVQRSGPSTGQATMPAQGDFYQVRWGTHGDHEAIALSAWSVQESFELTVEAFNLAERFRMPVVLLTDGETGHFRERMRFPMPGEVEIAPRKLAESGSDIWRGAAVPPMGEFGRGGSIHITGSTHLPNGMRQATKPEIHDQLVRRLVRKASSARDDLTRLHTLLTGDEEIMVVAHGVTARPAFAAVRQLREQGFRVGLIRLIGLWPFPGPRIAELSANAKAIIVPEMNLGQLNRELERYVDCEVVPLNKIGGTVFHVREIAEAAAALLGRNQ